jgi:hypothetical protein
MKLLRDTTPIDPEIQRRLDAIDAALAGEPVEAQYSDLAKLAQALRAERQLPAEAFADKLDERVSSGFEAQGRGEEGQDAHAGEAGRSLGRIDWSRLRGAWAPLAAGVAGSALLVSAIAGSGVLSGDSQSTRPAAPEQVVERPQAERGVAGDAATAPRTQRRGTAESATPNTKSAEGTLVPPSEAPPYPVNPGDDGARPREVARGASLVLATKPGDVEDAADQVVRITDEHRGYVLSSSVSGGEGNGRASFQLRIPASRLQAAIADLSEVAHIRERNQDTQDITSSFVSVRARIAAAQRERQALLRGLAAASTDGSRNSAHSCGGSSSGSATRASMSGSRATPRRAIMTVSLRATPSAMPAGSSVRLSLRR